MIYAKEKNYTLYKGKIMKKYKHKKIYVTICRECKKLIWCYRFNRVRKRFGKHPYWYCDEHWANLYKNH